MTSRSGSNRSLPAATFRGHCWACHLVRGDAHRTLGAQLNSWIAAVSRDDLPHLRRFVRGLDTDHAVVGNGLTLPYSSGAVEGHVNRIILWNMAAGTIMFFSGLTTELRRQYERGHQIIRPLRVRQTDCVEH